MLNSAGNIVGMIPKNFIIVIIENHHWVNMRRLTQGQRKKLRTMYQSVENLKMDQEKFGSYVSAVGRRFTTKKGVVGPQDWFMREFSRETMQYFKDNQKENPVVTSEFGELVKNEIMVEHAETMDNLFLQSSDSHDRDIRQTNEVRGITDIRRTDKL